MNPLNLGPCITASHEHVSHAMTMYHMNHMYHSHDHVSHASAEQGIRVWLYGMDIHYPIIYLSQVLHWLVIIGVSLSFLLFFFVSRKIAPGQQRGPRTSSSTSHLTCGLIPLLALKGMGYS